MESINLIYSIFKISAIIEDKKGTGSFTSWNSIRESKNLVGSNKFFRENKGHQRSAYNWSPHRIPEGAGKHPEVGKMCKILQKYLLKLEF